MCREWLVAQPKRPCCRSARVERTGPTKARAGESPRSRNSRKMTSLLRSAYQSTSTCHRCTNSFALAQVVPQNRVPFVKVVWVRVCVSACCSCSCFGCVVPIVVDVCGGRAAWVLMLSGIHKHYAIFLRVVPGHRPHADHRSPW